MYQNLTTFIKNKCCCKKPLMAFISLLVLSFYCSNQAIAQTSLGLGDIAFISYNSDPTVPAGTGTDQFGFVTFSSIIPGTQMSFTDRGWTTGTGFSAASTGESTITITYTQTLSPGDQVYIDANGNVFNQNGTIVGFYTGTPLNLTTAGDQIFAYQGAEPTPATQTGFISAIQMNGAWDTNGSTSSSSAQPTVFTDGVNSISINPEVDNASYNFSVTSGSTSTISSAINDATNWTMDNGGGFAAQDGNFVIDSGIGTAACPLEISCVAPLLTASCEAPPADVTSITILESCGDVTITFADEESGNLLDGTLKVTRTYTVTDNNGTAALADDLELSCLQIIEIQTPALPRFSCIDAQDVTCVADISPVTPQLTVECGDATVETTGPALTVGSPNCLGSIYTITYTATDQFGRIATCEQNFTINNSFPAVDCPADRNITCATAFIADTPSFSISCGGEGTTSVSEPVLVEGSAGCNGSIYEVTYSVTDNCDRTTDCIQRLTIANESIPEINCAPVPATATCEESIINADLLDFTVSCGTGTASATLALTSGNANCAGATYNVTYTVTDDCGRTASCVKSVQIANEAPTITCPDSGQVTCVTDINPLEPSVTTSCGVSGAVTSVGPTLVNGVQNQNGAVYEVVYTVTDLCGRTANCTQSYTITSNAITIGCPADVIVDCVSDIVEGESNVSSNCGGSVQKSVAGPTLISGEPNCGGAVYEITYSAVNNVGATASCTQNFTISENLPVLTCPEAKTVTCVAEIVAEAPTYTLRCAGSAQVASSNPVLISGTADCDGAVYEIDYTVTSNCGAVANCAQTFTISNGAPVINCVDGITATCASNITPIEPTFTVSCGETATVTNSAPVLVSGEANCSGSVYEITYTVTDACNREANCTQSVVINNDLLVVECPATQIVSCFEAIASGTPTFTTSCGVAADVSTVGPTLFLGEENCNGAVYAVNYTVTDACGNSAVCEQLFAIENDAPTIQCAANETVTCVDNIVLTDNLAAQSSCGITAAVTVSGPLLRKGTPNCTGAVYVATYSATDNCNRVVSCEQTFTISNAAPSITCIADATVSCELQTVHKTSL